MGIESEYHDRRKVERERRAAEARLSDCLGELMGVHSLLNGVSKAMTTAQGGALGGTVFRIEQFRSELVAAEGQINSAKDAIDGALRSMDKCKGLLRELGWIS